MQERMGQNPGTLGPYLSQGPLDVGRDFVEAQSWPLCAGNNGGDPLQEVGQVGGHGTGLITVKFREGLGFKIIKHEQGILPYKVHLEKRQKGKS